MALKFPQDSIFFEESTDLSTTRPSIIYSKYESNTKNYLCSENKSPLFLLGNALEVLRNLPNESVDCVMTSPPYWNKREYEGGGIGLESNYEDFIGSLLDICFEIRRVLKLTGSFWLNLGDTYSDKSLLGIPWRVILRLTDSQDWTLRNSIIWNKVKGGMDNSKDRLANSHENIFHLVKQSKGYYYDADKIRSEPGRSKVVNGAIVSATGVTGVKYQRQIELSNVLSDLEKNLALRALKDILNDLSLGKISDFRMIIRGQQRTTHSDSARISGRAKELINKGFYFLKYNPKGSKPGDVWDILPEDRQIQDLHFAPYPLDLCRIPLLATCPDDGIVLDPFCGTGTTLLAAMHLNLKSIGIDISEKYLKIAEERCMSFYE